MFIARVAPIHISGRKTKAPAIPSTMQLITANVPMWILAEMFTRAPVIVMAIRRN